ncbi:lipase maturation factor family protein [Mycobacterium sp. ITM-2016-00317]|uniref:lipase maturation factor family protein n=1 Tax=Mycobacterium sp. ITM-2016-00317 TaxID=2099694 RepID=UPI00287FC6D9|nr:lipase maturation factor family protein [Mycobacterium sp. ITM-2016-00317]WNG86526.1 lipase maturation factor family protein [Mycobacterium sp. ITM-2016-00317]
MSADWFDAPGYWVAREVLQRGIAAIYLIAFVGAARQFRALIGEHGMLPVPRFVEQVSFRVSPSLFHLHYSDRFFAAVCWSGAALSAALLAGGGDLVPLWAATLAWLVLWILYLSIVNVGQRWYGFGWESLLLEAGFLAMLLGNDDVAPPLLTLWLVRWLLFRVEFGAGLIKMRGDPCWRDLSCLDYHHETQPMPGPLSWFFHHLPKPLHRVEVAGNHVAQLVVPFALFAPQPVASVAAAIVIVTQLWLVLSGNFAWLNWLTIILAFSAVDQSAFARVLPASAPPDPPAPPSWFVALVIAATALTVVLSFQPVRNMLGRRQRMNASFNPFHLVNTYGAFGSIGRIRYEVILEGTDEAEPTAQTVWKEYGFKGKPGDPRRIPRQWAPYHLRLDWLMWFAALSPAYGRDWFRPLVVRLLRSDADTLRLLGHNPFPGTPPRYIRARLYEYRFTTWQELREERRWWRRTLVGEYLPAVGLGADESPTAR